MYEQIKQNNIGITKRITELQANVKRQLDKNEAGVTQKIEQFEQDNERSMEEFRAQTKKLLMSAKMNSLAASNKVGNRRSEVSPRQTGTISPLGINSEVGDLAQKKLTSLKEKVKELDTNQT